MTEFDDSLGRRVGLVLAFGVVAAIAGGLAYLLPLGLSLQDAVYVATIVLAFLLVGIVLDDSSI